MKAELGQHETLQYDAMESREGKTTLMSKIFSWCTSRKLSYLLFFLPFFQCQDKGGILVLYENVNTHVSVVHAVF